MTYEEALKLLEKIILYIVIKTGKPLVGDFVDTLKKALKKQTPIKPKFANNIYKQKCYWCPSCNNYLMEYYSDDNKLQLEKMSKFNPYCHWCGQAIDWSNE